MQKFAKTILKLVIDAMLILLAIILILVFLLWKDTWNPYENTIEAEAIPTFQKFNLDTGHVFNSETSLPVRWSTLIDLDWDNIDEIFLWGGATQADQVFAYRDASFQDVSSDYNISKDASQNTLAAASLDIDNNGWSDLIVSRESGVYIYYNTQGVLTQTQVRDLWLNEKSTPLGLTFGDINKDGLVDIFLSTYIKKQLMNGLTNFSPWYGATSALLLNNGDNSFSNISVAAGLDYIHNTFQWVFVDIDNDSWLDLVVAYDTGEPRIYKNNRDTTFSLVPNPFTGKYSYPMWIAVGDYDSNGFTDLMFSNIGSSLPKTMVKGDLENIDELDLGWILLKNNGDFRFEEVAESSQIRDFEFSWWAVFADMNTDGLEDLMVAENFVDLSFQKLFKLPGRLLLQKPDNSFVATEKASGVVNKHFGITPLVSDFNADGYMDMVWVNVAEPSFAFINDGGDKNYLQLALPDNNDSLGAKIIMTLDSGNILTQDYITGEWLVADQTNIIHFWLGDNNAVQQLEVRYINKPSVIIQSPEINSLLEVN